MSFDYVAYIDEAGDEGFEFAKRPERKSSEWFLLSAVICDVATTPSIKRGIEQFYKQFNRNGGGKATRSGRAFHFRKASHNHCVAFTAEMAKHPITIVTIICHKPSIPAGSALRRKHYLFDYCTKLLIERISEFCDQVIKKPNGKVKVIFSDRRQLKLERVRAYLERLRGNPVSFSTRQATSITNNRIKWRVIDLKLIDVLPHSSSLGLEMADAAVSGASKALEFCPHDTTEHRYVKMLRRRYFRVNGRCTDKGIKILPDWPDDDPFGPDRLHWLKHFK